MAFLDDVRRFWDDDAATYDKSPGHHPVAPAVQAAWLDAVRRFLPPAPARVLDVGAGTGFLALQAAQLGHVVTALDLSSGMLDHLRAKAAASGLSVTTVVGGADAPPDGLFDAVIERHVLWTLPDPSGALTAWRRVCPSGRLVLFETRWGVAADPWSLRRARMQSRLHQMLGHPSDHHAEYSSSLRDSLPLGRGTPPSELVALVERAGWGSAQVVDLAEVGRATLRAKPLPWRVFGVNTPFVVTAG